MDDLNSIRVGIAENLEQSSHSSALLRIKRGSANTRAAKEQSRWRRQMRGTQTRYRRAIDSAQSLIEQRAAIGQQWLKGIGNAESLMRPRLTCSLNSNLRFDRIGRSPMSLLLPSGFACPQRAIFTDADADSSTYSAPFCSPVFLATNNQ